MSNQLALALSVVAFDTIDDGEADVLLRTWGHYLGPNNRPFGSQNWALVVRGQPVSVAVSASTVSSTAAGRPRDTLVELARLCTAPDARWATRVALRLWREVGARAWPYWPPAAAVAYSNNDRHEGRIYRFDGWTRVATDSRSGGGGTWTDPRASGSPSSGTKTLWLFDLAEQPEGSDR